ncbi:Mu transposase C-terminal domain-containing protein [Glycomyces tritici]|uniref:Mu transposase C-terminal domain-containing protein n=1 Tax=Glycomyces tritici TaxID=2665176 RepID=A0ABT7YXF1_9ACTN|nr:Mu transposase C-terminal domain-containing protein [Glycomyces tritici]MDN3243034.1 Mu transposase C-terminal domain-containing protein [Glycomyces tritici]
MSEFVMAVGPGSQVLFDGDLVRIEELDAATVTVKVERTGQYRVLTLSRLITGCAALEVPDEPLPGGSIGTTLAGLTAAQREQLEERAAHLREVLVDDGRRQADRLGDKAAELGVTARTLERWLQDFLRDGEAGLVDGRMLRRRSTSVDPKWDAAVKQIVGEKVNASTPTRSAVIDLAAERLEDEFGAGVVPLPSRATAFRRFAELTRGTNAVSGSAKGRRSIADRPEGVYGRLRATRPGEYLILDTQDIDVFAMEPVTCRWVGAQLTIAQDLFTRCVVGMRVTAVSTQAVDVAGVLYEAVAGREAPTSWPPEAVWPYHGVPGHLVVDEVETLAGPVCAPETLVVDHGKVFLSTHVKGICARLGISIQPAQTRKPTDKPTVERFFRTLREGFTQHLPAYKGPDLHSRGERVEDQAFLFLHELEDAIREWIALVYHRTKHSGLAVAEHPGLEFSPAEMFAIGLAKAGYLRLPVTPTLALDFLPVRARTIQHYGVEIDRLRYNGPGLNDYRGRTSPFGGALAGKWPIRVDPNDVRYAWFQDPADGQWHQLDWEHAAMLHTGFSTEAAAYARRLAAARDEHIDPAKAFAGLLRRWDAGLVADRRERRMLARWSAEHAALPIEALITEPSRAATEDGADVVTGDDDEMDFDGDWDEGYRVLT